jgi:hypothetical protein
VIRSAADEFRVEPGGQGEAWSDGGQQADGGNLGPLLSQGTHQGRPGTDDAGQAATATQPVGEGQEAAETVAVEKAGPAGEGSGGLVDEPVDVVEAGLEAGVAPPPPGSSVTPQVKREHRVPRPGEGGGDVLVASAVLTEAVDENDDRSWLAVGEPPLPVEDRLPAAEVLGGMTH